MECLKNFIGISKKDCECFTKNLTSEEIEEMKISLSGLYLDQIEGGIKFNEDMDLSSCRSFYEIQKDAINNAQMFFETDIITQVFDNYKYKFDNKKFIGDVGEKRYTSTLAVNKKYQYLKIVPNNNITGYLTLNNVKLLVNKNAVLKLRLLVYKDDVFKEILNFEISTTADVMSSSNFKPLKLPLKSENNNINEYFLIWERSEDIKPRNNKIDCGCSGSSSKNYQKFIKIFGGETDNLTDIRHKTDRYTHGIFLNINVGCDADLLICNAFNNDVAFNKATGFCLIYKASELVIESILNSSKIDRFTMMDRQYLWGKRNHFRKEYLDRIIYLSKIIDFTDSNCTQCNDKRITISNLLS